MLNQCWPAQYLVLSRKQLGANFTYLNPKILWKRSDSACGQPPWFMSQRLMAPRGRVETMLLLSTPDSTFLSIQFPCLCLCQAARVTGHIQNLKSVLRCLNGSGLQLQPNKSEFMQQLVTFMGCVIFAEGISPTNFK